MGFVQSSCSFNQRQSCPKVLTPQEAIERCRGREHLGAQPVFEELVVHVGAADGSDGHEIGDVFLFALYAGAVLGEVELQLTSWGDAGHDSGDVNTVFGDEEEGEKVEKVEVLFGGDTGIGGRREG